MARPALGIAASCRSWSAAWTSVRAGPAFAASRDALVSCGPVRAEREASTGVSICTARRSARVWPTVQPELGCCASTAFHAAAKCRTGLSAACWTPPPRQLWLQRGRLRASALVVATATAAAAAAAVHDTAGCSAAILVGCQWPASGGGLSNNEGVPGPCTQPAIGCTDGSPACNTLAQPCRGASSVQPSIPARRSICTSRASRATIFDRVTAGGECRSHSRCFGYPRGHNRQVMRLGRDARVRCLLTEALRCDMRITFVLAAPTLRILCLCRQDRVISLSRSGSSRLPVLASPRPLALRM